MLCSVLRLWRIWFLGKSLRIIFLGVISLPKLVTRKRWNVRRGERGLKESNCRRPSDSDSSLDDWLVRPWIMHSELEIFRNFDEILLSHDYPALFRDWQRLCTMKRISGNRSRL